MADEKKNNDDNDDDSGTWTEIEVPEELGAKVEEVLPEEEDEDDKVLVPVPRSKAKGITSILNLHKKLT